MRKLHTVNITFGILVTDGLTIRQTYTESQKQTSFSLYFKVIKL